MDKTERFGLVLTPDERAAIARLADSDGGLSMAAAIRRLIRHEAQRRNLWSVTPSIREEVENGEAA